MALTELPRSSSNHIGNSIKNLILAQNRQSELLKTTLQQVVIIEQKGPNPNDLSAPSFDYIGSAASTGSSEPRALSNSSMKLNSSTSRWQNSTSSWAISIPRKVKCPEWCSCVCHKRSKIRSPWLLRNIFGEIVIEYSGKALDCDEYGCRPSASSSFNLTYYLPGYLMSRYVSLAMEYTATGGPKVSLRMPRIMGWEHLLWKYSKDGDIVAIRNMFAEGKASPDDVDLHGRHALMYAASHGKPQLGRFLLENGANPELTDWCGRKASEIFYERSFSGQFNEEENTVLKAMFENSEHMETCNFGILHKIVLGFVQKDLGSELDISTSNINEVDAQGRTPLCWATIRKDLLAVQTLLAFNANPNVPDNMNSTCLHYVRNMEICKSLLEVKADVHIQSAIYNRSPLHYLYQQVDNTDLIDLLINSGVDVDTRDADQETPLMNSIYRRFTPNARRLIELGANVNARNRSSQESPIHFAVIFDHHDIIQRLLDTGADYTAKNIKGRNIAHLAASMGNARTMEILSESKLIDLDVVSQDKFGKSPTDYIAERTTLTDSEAGLQENWIKLLESLPVPRRPSHELPHPPTRLPNSEDPEPQLNATKLSNIVGAYPISDEDE